MPQPKSSSGRPRKRQHAAPPPPRRPRTRTSSRASARYATLLARAVMLPTERVREAVDDAVRRGRITRDDAEELVQSLVAAGRPQTEDALADLEAARAPARRPRSRAAGVGGSGQPSGFPDPGLRRADRGADHRPPRRPVARRAAQGARLRARQRATASRSSRRVEKRARLPSLGRMPRHRRHPRPSGATSSSCASTRSPSAATASRASTATSSSSRGAIPGDRVRAVVTKRKRAYAEARARRGPRAVARARRAACADHPGAPWQVLPYERQLEVKHEQVDDALRRIGQLDGFELEPIVPAVEQWRYRNKLEYSFGTGDGRRARAAASTRPARWDEIDARRGLPAGLRARQRRARARSLDWAASRACAPYDRRAHDGLAAQPRRARGPAHRRAAGRASSTATGDARHRRRCRGGRRATASSWTRDRRARRDDRRAATPSSLAGAPSSTRSSAACASRISPEAFFQTNTEMAERLYGVAGEYAALAGLRARLRPLLRHRDDRADARAARRRGLGPGDRRGGGRRRDRATRARNEIDNARFFAGDVRLAMRELVESAGRPDVARRRPAARRACRRRSCAGSSRRRRSGSSTSRATRRRWRRTPRSSSRPATRCARVRPVDMFPQTPHIECVARPRPARPSRPRQLDAAATVLAAAIAARRSGSQERPDPEPGAGEVLVRVRAAGLNGADLLQRKGGYPAPPGSPPDIPGLELAGEVAALRPGRDALRRAATA